MTAPASGRLTVVGTPIGNLGDLSPRAAEALRAADLVVAEDTRVTARLLAHVGVRVRTLSFNAHNAEARLPQILERLQAGAAVALASDAGMPAVSDPGARLVAAARALGAEVTVVPGPSAVTAAIALAGVEAPGFVFGGFLPSRGRGPRQEALSRLLTAAGALEWPLVLFEGPHRLHALLRELATIVPDAQLWVGRELTKLHEESRAGTVSELAAHPPPERGEFTLVVWELPARRAAAPGVDLAAVARAANAAGLSERGVVDVLRAAGVTRREAYRLAHEAATAPG
jgi:16S rRNA (cytidine1402-2'-O)-methyltransferase